MEKVECKHHTITAIHRTCINCGVQVDIDKAMNNPMEQTKQLDQYKCQSYYDEANILQDCSCGKCQKQTWQGQFIKRFFCYEFTETGMTPAGAEKKAVAFIEELLASEREKWHEQAKKNPTAFTMEIVRGAIETERKKWVSEVKKEIRKMDLVVNRGDVLALIDKIK